MQHLWGEVATIATIPMKTVSHPIHFSSYFMLFQNNFL